MTWSPPATSADFYLLDEDNYVDDGWRNAISAIKGLRPAFEAQVTSPDPDFNDWNSQLQGLTFSQRGIGPTWRLMADSSALFYLQHNDGTATVPDWQNKLIVSQDGVQLSSFALPIKISTTNNAETEFESNVLKFDRSNFYLTTSSTGKPIVSIAGSTGGSGVSDHGDLTGLSDDDHTQYLLVDGTRAMTGDLNMGGKDVLNAAAGVFADKVSAEAFYVISKGEVAVKKTQQFTSAAEWQFTHGLNTLLFTWATFDTKYRSMFPDDVAPIDSNTAAFYFSSARSGFAVVTG